MCRVRVLARLLGAARFPLDRKIYDSANLMPCRRPIAHIACNVSQYCFFSMIKFVFFDVTMSLKNGRAAKDAIEVTRDSGSELALHETLEYPCIWPDIRLT